MSDKKRIDDSTSAERYEMNLRRYNKYRGSGANDYKKYTKKEISMLQDYNLSSREIAVALDRSLRSVEHKRSKMVEAGLMPSGKKRRELIAARKDK